MTEIIKYLSDLLNEYLKQIGTDLKITFDKTKDEKHGDLTTNIALVASKQLGKKPRDLAAEIISNIKFDEKFISKVEIAGPGFINFFVSDFYYRESLGEIIVSGDDYGKTNDNSGKKANLEWVSANPTKPLHAGHGRQIALGKAIANLLEWTGYHVTREYYYNDAGNQMQKLAESVYARYMQLHDRDFPFPEDGYQGEYIKNIAQLIQSQRKDSLKDSKDLEFFKTAGENYNFKVIRNTLNTFGINHDVFFNETELYKNKDIEKLLGLFKEKGFTYEQDGAVWLQMNKAEGFDKDKVIMKSTGEPTYRLPDMAYHINKLDRGFDLIIDIFGSDHGDTYKEVLYGVRSAGYDTNKIHVIIHQMVTFKMGDESVKMSGRSDTSYYLDELINDIGVDATQFFFVMRGANTHLDFDIKLAKEHSEKNPVYYLQYAHARISGILRNAEMNFADILKTDSEPNLLTAPEEMRLLKTLADFPEEVQDAARTYLS
jgi:arginyl-tRNA synthetase